MGMSVLWHRQTPSTKENILLFEKMGRIFDGAFFNVYPPALDLFFFGCVFDFSLPPSVFPFSYTQRLEGACRGGKRVKALSIDLFCDWPEREQATSTQFQRRQTDIRNLSTTNVTPKIIDVARLRQASEFAEHRWTM